MGLKSIFGKKKLKTDFDLGSLGIDVHSHLIPGIDDGSQSMEQTVEMLKEFINLGYKKVITTPHVMSDYYKNTPEIILNGLDLVRKEIEKRNLNIEIEAAAEYFFDEFIQSKITNKELLTFGDNYVLFEFSFTAAPTNKNELIFDLVNAGYHPVLAHYERYLYFEKDGVELVKDLKNRGVLIQMNLNSLSGHYGRKVQSQAEMLIDNKLVDFVGTDCHRIQHLDLLKQNLNKKYYHKLANLNLLNNTL